MSPTERKEVADQEKQFVAHFSEQHSPLPPEEVQQAPRNKELGRSSRALSVHDFELVRTLGTGACCCLRALSYMMCDAWCNWGSLDAC
jgi:protein kinase A